MEGLEGTEGVEGAHALPPPLFPPPPFPPPPRRGPPRGRRTYAPPFPATLPMAPLAPATLRVAEPPMPDPNFRRTVVLLCDHTTEGSFGLVLNRPCEFRLAEVATVPLPFDAALGFGGPVQVDTLHYVHPFGDLVEGRSRCRTGCGGGASSTRSSRGSSRGGWTPPRSGSSSATAGGGPASSTGRWTRGAGSCSRPRPTSSSPRATTRSGARSSAPSAATT